MSANNGFNRNQMEKTFKSIQGMTFFNFEYTTENDIFYIE